MPRKSFTPEQVIAKLRHLEVVLVNGKLLPCYSSLLPRVFGCAVQVFIGNCTMRTAAPSGPAAMLGCGSSRDTKMQEFGSRRAMEFDGKAKCVAGC